MFEMPENLKYADADKTPHEYWLYVLHYVMWDALKAVERGKSIRYLQTEVGRWNEWLSFPGIRARRWYKIARGEDGSSD